MFGRGISRYRKETVLVHTKDGSSIRGALASVFSDGFELRGASMLLEDGSSVPLDGSVVIPRGNIEFFQTLTVVS